MKILFNVPPYVGSEIKYIQSCIKGRNLCGDGPYTQKCELLLERMFGVQQVLLTPSCTASLEMAAI